MKKKNIRNNIIKNKKKIKLMVINYKKKIIIHDSFINIYKYFKKKDIIIYNNIKTYKSIILGYKKKTKNKIKIILINKIKKNIWEASITPSKKIRTNNKINFYNKKKKILTIQIIDNTNTKYRLVKIIFKKYKLKKIIKKIGKYYLPKYIKSNFNYKKYKNYFNSKNIKKKSIILPTENINFNNKIFLKLKSNNIKFIKISSLINHLYFNKKIFNNIFENFKINKKIKKIFLNIKKYKNKKITAIGINILKIIENNINNFNIYKYKKWINNNFNNNFKFKIINTLLCNLNIKNTIYYLFLKKFIKNINIFKLYKIIKKNKYKLGIFGDYILIIKK
ncbi:MAG: S-adenosylmethionine:tRNA ribosyltransferase-isomerase [Candidatus Shikimatogenerans sp. Tcar]|uniref:S-adenosylmethionine:tRNA ribosyltransferase-isomerase n=1 Tax=Candidatus Shikimatogenerans sp. Tcar TaxID=3158565 RepID=A0AAU7QSJ0_9FLAO